MAALLAGVAIEIPRKGNLEMVKAMISNTKKMRSTLRQLVEPKDEENITAEQALQAWHTTWPHFWRAFGFSYDHEALVLPEYREGFGWSIVTPPQADWPMSKLLHEVCERMFPTWQAYNDEDLDKITSPKEPTDTNVVLARNRIEADEEHQNQSAQTIETTSLSTMTPRQRLVLEARYFLETSGHLDTNTMTICANSRYTDGCVPYVYWDDGRFSVGLVYPDDADGLWRVREVVSLPAYR